MRILPWGLTHFSARMTSRRGTARPTKIGSDSLSAAILLSLVQFMAFAICASIATVALGIETDVDQVREFPISDSERNHWSFKPIIRPSLPHVQARQRANNAIDFFILEQLEQSGLSIQPEANRSALIRRLTFDLLGLPPTIEELERFELDALPDAYERLVDRLLASPRYGERWGQYWLDLARFAETDGFEHDKLRSDAWRYRDWVISALNQDLPYDQFVRLQLAGDEIAPNDPSANIATAFCLSGPDMPDINSQEERRDTLLNEITSTVGSVFLGLQMGCAQCHDHKFDPISQADFYRLRAVFEPAIQVVKDKSVRGLRESGGYALSSHLMLRGDWRRPGPAIQAGYPRIANPKQAIILDRAAPTSPDPSSEAKPQSSGRRSDLADWIVSPSNPLTARVIVNRLWQHHFGFGLTRTPSDFGATGADATHSELLDWLATDLVENGWSLKRTHRLIVLSATYRQSSFAPHDEEVRGQDPNNLLLSHYPRRRLEGEAIRDAILASAGLLSLEQGGPGVRPPLPEELVNTLLKDQWTVTPATDQHYRRGIYLFVRRNLRFPVFEVFDRPDANASCPVRSRSTTAVQSLMLLNSDLSHFAAKQLAQRIPERTGDPTEQIRFAFRKILGRFPNEKEAQSAERFLSIPNIGSDDVNRHNAIEQVPREDKLTDLQQTALSDLCLALFNTNEFVYID